MQIALVLRLNLQLLRGQKTGARMESPCGSKDIRHTIYIYLHVQDDSFNFNSATSLLVRFYFERCAHMCRRTAANAAQVKIDAAWHYGDSTAFFLVVPELLFLAEASGVGWVTVTTIYAVNAVIEGIAVRVGVGPLPSKQTNQHVDRKGFVHCSDHRHSSTCSPAQRAQRTLDKKIPRERQRKNAGKLQDHCYKNARQLEKSDSRC